MSNSSGQVSIKIPIIEAQIYFLLLLLLSCFSRVRLLATPWTAAYQAPPSTHTYFPTGFENLYDFVSQSRIKDWGQNYCKGTKTCTNFTWCCEKNFCKLVYHLCHHFRYPDIKRQAALCCTGLGHLHPVLLIKEGRAMVSFGNSGSQLDLGNTGLEKF